MSKKTGFLTGVAIGAAAGVLFAPKSGAETRAELSKKIKLLLDNLKEELAKIDDFDDIEYNLEDKIVDIKNELAALDREKVKKIASKQAQNIKNKAEEIYEIAKSKGTPVLEKAAEDVRKKSAELLYSMADGLEATKKKSKKNKE